MNPDIRISTGFVDHPKTKRVIRETGFEGVLCLLRFWSWCAKERPDGDLAGLDDMAIADAAGWPMDRDPKTFVDALRGRFLDGEPGAHSLHDWEEHNPWAAAADERSLKAKRAAHVLHHVKRRRPNSVCLFCREDVANGGECLHVSEAPSMPADATSMQPAPEEHASGNAPSPSPSPAPISKENPPKSPQGGTRRTRRSRSLRTNPDLAVGKRDDALSPEADRERRRAEHDYFAPIVEELIREHGPPQTPAEIAEWWTRHRIAWNGWLALEQEFGTERRTA